MATYDFSRQDGAAKKRDRQFKAAVGDAARMAKYLRQAQFEEDDQKWFDAAGDELKEDDALEAIKSDVVSPGVVLVCYLRLRGRVDDWHKYAIALKQDKRLGRQITSWQDMLSTEYKAAKLQTTKGLTQAAEDMLQAWRGYYRAMTLIASNYRALGAAFARECNARALAVDRQTQKVDCAWTTYFAMESRPLQEESTGAERDAVFADLAAGKPPAVANAKWQASWMVRREERLAVEARRIVREMPQAAAPLVKSWAISAEDQAGLKQGPPVLPGYFRNLIVPLPAASSWIPGGVVALGAQKARPKQLETDAQEVERSLQSALAKVRLSASEAAVPVGKKRKTTPTPRQPASDAAPMEQ